MEKLWERETHENRHIFTEKHFESGLSNIPKSQRKIFKRVVEIVKRADSQGLLGESSNDIRTVIEGIKVTVRVYIRNGKVESINCFPNHSNRVINRLVELE